MRKPKKPKQESKTERVEFLLDLLRDDGRPEVYDVPKPLGVSDGYACFVCEQKGFLFRRHQPPDVYMTSPTNTPGNRAAFICKEHLPEEAVIFNAGTNQCRDKKGENVWTE